MAACVTRPALLLDMSPWGKKKIAWLKALKKSTRKSRLFCFAEGELLVQRDVHHWDSVSAQGGKSGITQCLAGRLVADIRPLAEAAVVDRRDKGAGIEPAIDTPFVFSEIAVADPIHPQSPPAPLVPQIPTVLDDVGSP